MRISSTFLLEKIRDKDCYRYIESLHGKKYREEKIHYLSYQTLKRIPEDLEASLGYYFLFHILFLFAGEPKKYKTNKTRFVNL